MSTFLVYAMPGWDHHKNMWVPRKVEVKIGAQSGYWIAYKRTVLDDTGSVSVIPNDWRVASTETSREINGLRYRTLGEARVLLDEIGMVSIRDYTNSARYSMAIKKAVDMTDRRLSVHRTMKRRELVGHR